MFNEKLLFIENLNDFDFIKTKKNIQMFFKNLQKLEWKWKTFNFQKGLISNYDFDAKYKRIPYSPIGKDIFNLSIKEFKEEEFKKYMSNYHWAINGLNENEQSYIIECFFYRKNQDEIADLLGFTGKDCHNYRNLRKSAIYKFADLLNLVEK